MPGQSLPQASSGWKPSPIPQAPPPGCSEPSVTCALDRTLISLYGTGLAQDGVSVPLQATQLHLQKTICPKTS